MTDGEFLNAVALGQVTPGPVVQTVAVVGYAAAGHRRRAARRRRRVRARRSAFILLGAERFDRLRANPTVARLPRRRRPRRDRRDPRLAVPLALALSETWQFAVLAAAAVALFVLRRGVVLTLIAAGIAGALASALGAPLAS